MSEKSKNILIIVLISIIIILVIGMVILVFQNIRTEDKLDYLEDHYEYLNENNNQNNVDDNIINSDKSSNNDNQNISQNEALEIVLKDLKIAQNDIRDLDIELDYEPKYQKNVYEVSFEYKYYEYEYYLEPATGKILDSFKSLN